MAKSLQGEGGKACAILWAQSRRKNSSYASVTSGAISGAFSGLVAALMANDIKESKSLSLQRSANVSSIYIRSNLIARSSVSSDHIRCRRSVRLDPFSLEGDSPKAINQRTYESTA